MKSIKSVSFLHFSQSVPRPVERLGARSTKRWSGFCSREPMQIGHTKKMYPVDRLHVKVTIKEYGRTAPD